MKLFKRKEKGIILKNEGLETHLIVNGVDISEYVLSYEIKQKGGEEPKLVIEIMTNRVEIVSKKLKKVGIITHK